MKKYDVLLTPDAIQDLKDIYEYIVDASGLPQVAWAYIEKLRGECHSLETVPLRGQKRDDLRKNLRVVPIDKNAVVAFEINEKKRIVTILNIFYGGSMYYNINRITSHFNSIFI